MPRQIQLRTIRRIAREMGVELHPGEAVPNVVMDEVDRRRAAAAAERGADREERRRAKLAEAVAAFDGLPMVEVDDASAAEDNAPDPVLELLATLAETDDNVMALLAAFDAEMAGLVPRGRVRPYGLGAPSSPWPGQPSPG